MQIILLIYSLLFVNTLFAQNITRWQGSIDNNFGNVNNWDNGIPSIDKAAVIINANVICNVSLELSSLELTNTVFNTSQTLVIATLRLTSSTVNLLSTTATVSNLYLNATETINTPTTITGNELIKPSLIVSKSFYSISSPSSKSPVVINCHSQLTSTCVSTIVNRITLLERDFTNNGALSLVNANVTLRRIIFTIGVAFGNYGNMNMTGNTDFTSTSGSTEVLFRNVGTLNIYDALRFVVHHSLGGQVILYSPNAVIDVQSGTSEIAGFFTLISSNNNNTIADNNSNILAASILPTILFSKGRVTFTNTANLDSSLHSVLFGSATAVVAGQFYPGNVIVQGGCVVTFSVTNHMNLCDMTITNGTIHLYSKVTIGNLTPSTSAPILNFYNTTMIYHLMPGSSTIAFYDSSALIHSLSILPIGIPPKLWFQEIRVISQFQWLAPFQTSGFSDARFNNPTLTLLPKCNSTWQALSIHSYDSLSIANYGYSSVEFSGMVNVKSITNYNTGSLIVRNQVGVNGVNSNSQLSNYGKLSVMNASFSLSGGLLCAGYQLFTDATIIASFVAVPGSVTQLDNCVWSAPSSNPTAISYIAGGRLEGSGNIQFPLNVSASAVIHPGIDGQTTPLIIQNLIMTSSTLEYDITDNVTLLKIEEDAIFRSMVIDIVLPSGYNRSFHNNNDSALLLYYNNTILEANLITEASYSFLYNSSNPHESQVTFQSSIEKSSTSLRVIVREMSNSTSVPSQITNCLRLCANGVCSDTGVCTCNEGYQGSTCSSYYCSNAGPLKAVCNNQGTCNGPNQCSCYNGYSETDCGARLMITLMNHTNNAVISVPPPPCYGGCVDPIAINYNHTAIYDDGSCTYNTITTTIDQTTDDTNDTIIETISSTESNDDQSIVSPPKKKSKNTGAIIGGAIGGALGFLLMLVGGILLFFILKKRRNQGDPSSSEVAMESRSVSTMANGSAVYGVMPSKHSQHNDNNSNNSGGSVQTHSALVAKMKDNTTEIAFSELKFETVIGKGSGGIVHAGRWRGGPVAIKVIPAGLLMENISEIAIMKNLRPHTNVVQFLGVSHNDDKSEFYIVTQLCEGGSLYSYLHSDEKLTVATIHKIVKGVAAGMYHLHTEGVVHRDLAARNILLDLSFEGKVSDFGLSRTSEGTSESQTQSNVGPLKHMAPECLLKRKYSTKSDVWAFGVVLYEIFTRGDPYPGISAIEAASWVVQSIDPLRLEPPANMSEEMKQLFKDCLATSSEQRPSFEEIVLRLEKMTTMCG